ncbi:MAG: hypothetical protein WAU32_00140 [Thermoanaerobaculia bacterium]
MTLAAGTRLGPYEIVSPIGAGGMGEVYRARDKKLDRDVAIKVLPQSVATDPDTLARFEREAKAVAAVTRLNYFRYAPPRVREGWAVWRSFSPKPEIALAVLRIASRRAGNMSAAG